MSRESGELVQAALAAGALEAEVFWKRGRGRRVVLEPGLQPGAAPVLTVSTSEEEGTAIRVVDRHGRRGFAWIGLPRGESVGASLLEAAWASARHDPEGGARHPPLGPGPRTTGEHRDLRIHDPECMALPPERIAALLMEAAVGAGGESGSVVIDRLALSEVETTIALANSRGFSGSYTKSLVHLSLALVPAEAGAAAVVEERSACRLADLDARGCIRDALLRAGPSRPAQARDTSEAVPLLLTPRAAASFLAAIAPWALSGEPGIWKGCALAIADDATIPARPGTAPFDGAGYETRRIVLVRDGELLGRLSGEGGTLVRPSYRDLPRLEPAGLLILPSGGPERGDLESRAVPDDAPAPHGGPGSDASVALSVQIVEVVPGPTWSLRIRRGEVLRGGVAIGPADGLVWEGPLSTLLRGVSAVGRDMGFYHCGAPVGTPGLRIDGLRPLRAESPGRSAQRV
jgi:predicted Zn-dependent protease